MDSQQLKCINCNNPYVLEGRKQRLPLLLSCSHVYCSVCISTLVKKLQSDTIPCPQCRASTPLSSNSSVLYQLPVSVYTVGAIRVEQLGLTQERNASAGPVCNNNSHDVDDDETEEDNEFKMKVIPSLVCEECESKMAEVKCEKCEALFCTNCFDIVHCSSRILRKSHNGILLGSTTDSVPETLKDIIKDGKKKLLLLKELKNSKSNQVDLKPLTTMKLSFHQKLESEFHKYQKMFLEKQASSDKNWNTLKREASVLERNINSLISKASHIKPEDFCRDMEDMIERATELIGTSRSLSRETVKVVTIDSTFDIDLSKYLIVEQTWEPIKVASPSSDSERESTPKRIVTPSKSNDRLTLSVPRYSKSPSSRSSSFSSREPSSSRGGSPFVEPVSPMKEDLQNAVGCFVTHVESPSEFWVILDEEKPKLTTLNKFLQKHCESHTENPTMKEGIVCAVKDTSGDWKRALIEKVVWTSPNHLVIHKLDDGGGSHMVGMSKSRSIPDNWSSMAPLAHKCSLNGIQPTTCGRMSSLVPNDWSQSCISYLRSIVLQQTRIKLKIISKEWCNETKTETLLVDLYLPSTKTGGISVIHQLISQGKAEKVIEKPLVPSNLPLGPIPPVDRSIEVEMITADSPNDFYVINSINDDSTLNRVSELISSYINCGPAKVAPSRLVVGTLVLAPYEGNYYRAKILDIGTDGSVSVRYLDYGNVSNADVTDLYEITRKLMKIPAVSYHCCLSSSTKDWPETVCHKFYQVTEGEKLLMTVTASMEDGIIPVTLQFQKSKKDVGRILEDLLPSSPKRPTIPSSRKPNTPSPGKSTTPPFRKQATPPPKKHTPLPSISVKKEKRCPPPPVLPPIGFNGPVIIKNCTTPLDFHVILADNRKVFNRIELCLPNTTQLELFRPVVGSYCHALYGNQYHRAIVQSVSTDGLLCTIYYIDYGNTESVPLTTLLPLSDSLCDEPALAIPCRLHEIEQEMEFSFSQNVEFYKLVFEKEAIALVKDISKSDPPSLVLSLMIKGTTGYDDVLKICTTVASSRTTPSLTTSSASSESLLPDHHLSFSSETTGPTLGIKTMISPNSSVSPPPGLSLQSFTYSKPEYPSTDEFSIVVTFVTSDGTIYGQPLPYAHMVEEVYNSISVFTKVPRPVSSIGVLSEGQGCIALFSEDQQWYRAVVVNIDTESAEVLFIDFGNTTQCLPHAIINKMACPSIPGLAISFNEHKHLRKEILSNLLDKELVVKKQNDKWTLMLKEIVCTSDLSSVPLPSSSSSNSS